MSANGQIYEGSCLCGRVRYRATGPLGEFGNCHCTDCQKSHGAAFASYIEVPRQRFTIVQGENHLQAYQAESGARRLFCRTCGAKIISESDAWEAVYVSAGTLDTPLDQKLTYHIWVRSKAPWYEICDGLPQHATNPDSRS